MVHSSARNFDVHVQRKHLILSFGPKETLFYVVFSFLHSFEKTLAIVKTGGIFCLVRKVTDALKTV